MCVNPYNTNYFIQIRTKLRLADTTTKNFRVQKRGFLLEPWYAGMCMFSTKKFETLMHAI